MFKWILGLLLGCCALITLTTTLSTLCAVSLITVALPVLYLQKHSKHPLLSLGIVLLSGFFMGLGWSSIHASWRLLQQVPSPENQSVHIIEAELKSLPAIYPEYCQFEAKVTKANNSRLLGKNLLLKDYANHCRYQLGELWSMTVKLKPIQGPVNKAGFDYELYMFQQRLDAKGYIKKSQKMKSAMTYSISNLRQSIFTEFSNYSNAGLLQALLIGEKAAIPKHDKDLLQNLGLSHLIAISGLHISIVAGVGLFFSFNLLGWINRSCRRNITEPLRPAVIIGCFVALFYTVLADFSLPTVRALIMWCCVSASMLLQRPAALFSGIKASLGIILLIDPLSVMSASFWMSYLAVIVISLVLAGRVMAQSGIVIALKRLFSIQLAISMTLILPSLFFFQQATLLVLLVNIVIIPLFSLLVLPLIIIAAILDFSGLTDVLMVFVDSSISHFLALGRLVEQSLRSLSFSVYLPPWLLITMLIIALFLWLPLGKLRYGFVIFAMTLIGSYYVPLYLPNNKFSSKPLLVVFDVGHGLAALLTDGNHHILYDTGYGAEGGSAYKSYIAPTLNRLNISHLDALILSHQDNDHSGGFNDIQADIPVGVVVAGLWARHKYHREDIELCQTGFSRTIGSFTLEALHPQDSSAGSNNGSCVVKVRSSLPDYHFSILLTGDIEKDVEYSLAENRADELKADLLLVPHHGSNSSSTYPFIKQVNPDLAIYSTERFSRYQLPNNKVMARYLDFNIPQIDTGCYGQITYFLDQGVYEFERSNRKFWRLKPCEVVEK